LELGLPHLIVANCRHWCDVYFEASVSFIIVPGHFRIGYLIPFRIAQSRLSRHNTDTLYSYQRLKSLEFWSLQVLSFSFHFIWFFIFGVILGGVFVASNVYGVS
jgi:hypothetical protein